MVSTQRDKKIKVDWQDEPDDKEQGEQGESIHVRLPSGLRQALQSSADKVGLCLSSYIRMQLCLSQEGK